MWKYICHMNDKTVFKLRKYYLTCPYLKYVHNRQKLQKNQNSKNYTQLPFFELNPRSAIQSILYQQKNNIETC